MFVQLNYIHHHYHHHHHHQQRYRTTIQCNHKVNIIFKAISVTTTMKRSLVVATKTTTSTTAEPTDVAMVWEYRKAIASSSTTKLSHHHDGMLNEPYIHVSLQPIITDETSKSTSATRSTLITTSDTNGNPTTATLQMLANDTNHCITNSDGHTTIDQCDDDNNNASTTNSKNDVLLQNVIPESVLIYERQIRKAQHAKKTSRSLSDTDLNIVHVDEYIVVVNKPAGVLTVPGINHNNSILDLVYNKYGIDSVTDPVHMIVHRLDMDTSGIVVFARTLDVAKQLHRIFRDRLHITKQYECLVMGHLRVPYCPQEATTTTNRDNENESITSPVTSPDCCKIVIDLPIQRDHVHPPFMRISTPRSEKAAMECVDQLQLHGWKKLIRKAAKSSQSVIVQVLEYGNYKSNNNNINSTTQSDVVTDPMYESSLLPFTRLRLEPITGRTHQLRVHCAAIGYPIVGDPTYSLYGEAAMFGGLENLQAYMRTSEDKQTCQIPITTTKAVTSLETDVQEDTKIRATEKMSRCSINVMKAWTSVYPPNVQPMCLHAAYLKLQHPVTGEVCEWHAPATF